MIVTYKICPRNWGDKIRPVFHQNRVNFLKFCHKSLIINAGEVIDRIFYIVDAPTWEILKMIEEDPKTADIVFLDNRRERKEVSVGKTFVAALDVARKFPNEDILMLEDDYFFLPGSGKRMVETLRSFEVITPYFHPDVKLEDKEKRIVNGRDWVKVPNTCLTFACRGTFIEREYATLSTHESHDNFLWEEITKRNELWSPVETLATHMEKEFLSPGPDWDLEFNKILQGGL
jgi:hypothetical protein